MSRLVKYTQYVSVERLQFYALNFYQADKESGERLTMKII